MCRPTADEARRAGDPSEKRSSRNFAYTRNQGCHRERNHGADSVKARRNYECDEYRMDPISGIRL